MKPIIIFFFTCTSLHLFGQLEQLKGTWVSKNNDVLYIKDTISAFKTLNLSNTKRAFINSKNYLWNSEEKRYCELVLKMDTLIFVAEYIANPGNGRACKIIRKELNFKVVKLDGQMLSISPISKLSKAFLKGAESIDFRKQLAEADTSIKLEKIIFHTTSCFGACPVLHMEITNKKNVNYFAEVVYKKGSRLKDSSSIGYYKGIMSNLNYSKLELLVQSTGIDTLNYKEVKCCDGPIKTLIVYYNKGNRKYIKSMILPPVLTPLILFLNDTKNHTKLKKTTQKFTFEQ